MCEAATGSGLDAALVCCVSSGRCDRPIGLEPVDEVVVTTLVDNVYDALLPSDQQSPVSFGAGLAEVRSSRTARLR